MFQRTAGALVSLERFFLMTVGLALLILLMFEVFARYVIAVPMLWVEEVIVYIIFWYYMVGAVYSTYERTYIKGGVIHLFLKSPKARGYFNIVTTLIPLALCLLFSVWGFQDFIWNFNVKSTTMMLYLPLEWAHLAIFAGFSLMALYFLKELIDSTRYSSKELKNA